MESSDMSNFEMNDLHRINILMCYLLYRIKDPISPDHLYEIVLGTDLINYFYYQDSIDFLLKNDSIILIQSKKGEPLYQLTEKGTLCAKRLRDYVPKYFRDRLVLAALKYIARQRYEDEIKIEYIQIENGYYLHLRCLDRKDDLLEMKMYAPDLRHAKLLGEKIMNNPTGFYGKVLNLALNNEEETYDLSDN